MDFKSYITAIEKQLAQMTEAQKTDWIFQQARIVEENQREKFLESLTGKNKTATELSPKEILEWCKKIEDGKLYFEAEEYEYYGEDYWESDWRTEYRDVFGIGEYLKKMQRFIHIYIKYTVKESTSQKNIHPA